ncbi:SusC/RagA family TonB-linked outer membrane protein, partial [Zobellia sp. B3R18]|nr:SusC/RagA family TonB-linked outer membrane protein [Zobellia sp. B3R18]
MEIKLTPGFFLYRKKLLLNIMRTAIFLLCFSVFGATPSNVFSQNVKIKIDKSQTVTVDQVFDLIMSQTDYTFIYQVDMFENFPKVKLTKGTIDANKLLRKSLPSGQFNVSLANNKTIIIKETKQQQQQQ